ncbi:MAG: response regulator [Planctomycetes bacterium]|nr:response regulator [Planctomycetota bacterium]
MPRILVVDDSPLDRARVGSFLEKSHADYRVAYAADGLEALTQIERTHPDIVVTDLQMPEMDGFELVRAVKEQYPLIPVILITAKGSEEAAARALREGAVSYVPKSAMSENLPGTVERTLGAAYRDKLHSRLMHALDRSQTSYTLQNDPELIELVVHFFEEMLRGLPLRDEGERIRCGEALKHALWHVWLYGNLEIDPETEQNETIQEEVRLRSRMLKFSSRSMTVEADISPHQAEFQIRHEGPPLTLPSDEVSFADSEKPFARGILLMYSLFDSVVLTDEGRTLRLTKLARTDEELDVGVPSDEVA